MGTPALLRLVQAYNPGPGSSQHPQFRPAGCSVEAVPTWAQPNREMHHEHPGERPGPGGRLTLSPVLGPAAQGAHEHEDTLLHHRTRFDYAVSRRPEPRALANRRGCDRIAATPRNVAKGQRRHQPSTHAASLEAPERHHTQSGPATTAHAPTVPAAPGACPFRQQKRPSP
jgi:hypothetical protein